MNRFSRIKNTRLFITHDLGMIAEIAQTIAVMYAGNDFTSVWFMVYSLQQKNDLQGPEMNTDRKYKRFLVFARMGTSHAADLILS